MGTQGMQKLCSMNVILSDYRTKRFCNKRSRLRVIITKSDLKVFRFTNWNGLTSTWSPLQVFYVLLITEKFPATFQWLKTLFARQRSVPSISGLSQVYCSNFLSLHPNANKRLFFFLRNTVQLKGLFYKHGRYCMYKDAKRSKFKLKRRT